MGQIRFVMHPDDETAFAAQVLEEENVWLVDGPRWKTKVPPAFRSLEKISGSYCIIWSRTDMSSLRAKFIANGNEWYCASEGHTIQFLRSEKKENVLTEGRIATYGGNEPIKSLPEGKLRNLQMRYNRLQRLIKKSYVNKCVRWCNPSIPFGPARPNRSANPGDPDAQLWIGPAALTWLQDDSNRRIKQTASSMVEAVLANNVV